MWKEVGYVISRPEADRAWDILKSHFPEAILEIASQKYYPNDGGIVVEVVLSRGGDKIQIYNFLGEEGDDVGPFDNKCWILMFSKPWWRAKWNQLLNDVDHIFCSEFGRVARSDHR